MGEKQPTSFRLSKTTLKLIDKFAEFYGVDKTGAIEVVFREMARMKGLAIPEDGE